MVYSQSLLIFFFTSNIDVNLKFVDEFWLGFAKVSSIKWENIFISLQTIFIFCDKIGCLEL